MSFQPPLISVAELQRYFATRYWPNIRIAAVTPLGTDQGDKGFGYGIPLKLTLEGAPFREVVLHRPGTTGFGHDTLADRALEVILPFQTFNNLPGHVRAIDMGAIRGDGQLQSLASAEDFYLLTEFGEGEPYFRDLERLLASGATQRDIHRADMLATHLARIHKDRKDAPELYRRRTRDLMGGHECIAGLIDSYNGYSLDGYTNSETLEEIERRCVPWRHRLKHRTERLCRIHGDFHPWNILFDQDDRLVLLDRSRGEWGEAADDLAALAINFVFFSLRAHGEMRPPFSDLWLRFFSRYLDESGDEDVLKLIPPFLVWRALVVASPVWYPHLGVNVRAKLFGFIDRILDADALDWRAIGQLMDAS